MLAAMRALARFVLPSPLLVVLLASWSPWVHAESWVCEEAPGSGFSLCDSSTTGFHCCGFDCDDFCRNSGETLCKGDFCQWRCTDCATNSWEEDAYADDYGTTSGAEGSSLLSTIISCLCCAGCIGGIVACCCCCCHSQQSRAPPVAQAPPVCMQPQQVIVQPQPQQVGGIPQWHPPSQAPAPAFATASSTTSLLSAAEPQSVVDINVEVKCGACHNQCRVSAATGRCQYTCPSCGAVNEFQCGSGSADPGRAPIPVKYPSYWNLPDDEKSVFEPETEEVKIAIQAMLNKTWKNQWTRDRGKDSKICKFEVVSVQRNWNPKIWASYYRLREGLVEQLRGNEIPLYDDVKTEALTCDVPECSDFFERAQLKREVNEFYLFHGTSPAAAKSICDNDFRVDKAGSNAGTMYGPGCYLAEASTKADEYASDDKGTIFADHFGMLVCRVVCGNINYNDAVSPPVQDLVDSVLTRKTHHAILGDREKCRGTYREFIVFDNRQIYPEFVAIYKRVS